MTMDKRTSRSGEEILMSQNRKSEGMKYKDRVSEACPCPGPFYILSLRHSL